MYCVWTLCTNKSPVEICISFSIKQNQALWRLGWCNSGVLSQDVKMRWQVPGTSNDAGLCCKAFKLATLQAILILAARQWGFLLGGQVVHQGIQESEAGHHTVAVDLYKS